MNLSFWKEKQKISHIKIIVITGFLLASFSFFLTVSGTHPQSSSLLNHRFGVNLTLLPPHDGVPYPSFNLSSFSPTKNLESVQWTGPCDWYGNWNFYTWETTTVWGLSPSGGEWYDVEAIYFDINTTHLFIVVVTSVPFYNHCFGEWGVGVKEQRWNVENNWVRPGDLSLNLNLSTPRVERFDVWSYDYGIDIIHENRDLKSPLDWGNTFMRDNNLGSTLYKTNADSGGGNIQDPGHGYDWYTASWYTTANWKHTNFDPQSVFSSPVLEEIGNETDGIVVDYYRYYFTGDWVGYEENNAETWVIEAMVPLRLFKEGDWPPPGGTMGIQWISSCRNDASFVSQFRVQIPTRVGDFVWEDLDADGIQDGGEPGIPDVSVHLLDARGEVVDSVVTDSMGRYELSDVSFGEYYVEVVLPDGFAFSDQGVGGDDGVDSDVDPASGVTGLIDLVAGEVDLTWDAGAYRLSGVGDFVWEDLDADGIQDEGELGIPGVSVHLFNSSLDEIDSTVTDLSGYYGFSGLMTGEYYLGFDLPRGYMFSQRYATDEENDSNADIVSGLTEKIEVDPGQFDLSNDVGLFREKENNPPSKPAINGPATGHVNTLYNFSTVSFDNDSNTIQYIFDWGDGNLTRTEFLSSGKSSFQVYKWSHYGEYFITVKAFDKQDETHPATHKILIDVVRIDNLINGYLVDEDGDGIYDFFINTDTDEQIDVGKENSTYLIDSDGDGRWDHTYNPQVGVLTYYQYLYDKYYEKVFGRSQETPGFEIVSLLMIMTLVLIIMGRKR